MIGLLANHGSQFTSTDFTKVLLVKEIKISMDGRGAGCDNVFVERLWKWIKYEESHLRADDTVSEARASTGRYLDFYNGRRPHSRLGWQSSILQSAASCSSLTPADDPLIEAASLFRPTEPPL